MGKIRKGSHKKPAARKGTGKLKSFGIKDASTKHKPKKGKK